MPEPILHSRFPWYGWLVAGVVFVGLIAGLAFLFTLKKETAKPSVPIQEQKRPGLGEEGATCGGKLRLPCRPGTLCVVNDDAAQTGVCVKVSDNPAPVVPEK